MSYFEYKAGLDYGGVLENVCEDPIYYKRPCRISGNYMKVYKQNLTRKLLDRQLSSSNRILVTSFNRTLQNQLGYTRKYDTLFESVAFDEQAYVELAGVLELQRQNCYLVDLGDSLDVLLAFISGDTLGSIRSGIQHVCQKYDISYRILSRAFITEERELMNLVRMEYLYEISPKIDLLCKRILKKGHSISGYKEFRNVDILGLGLKDLLQLVLQYQILLDTHYILSEIIKQYSASKVSNSDAMLTSKGPYSIMINSDHPNKQFVFNVDLRDDLQLQVRAIEFKRGSYLDVLCDDTAERVVVLGGD